MAAKMMISQFRKGRRGEGFENERISESVSKRR
jgi:hypothetical protein